MLKKNIKYSFATIHSQIAIIGAGTGGVNLAAHLSRSMQLNPTCVRIFDPSKIHYYQPAFTMIGGGLCNPSVSQGKMEKIIPKLISFTNYKVDLINPEENSMITEDGTTYTFEQLVIAPGINPNPSLIPGLKEALEDPDCPVVSIYGFKAAQKTWKYIKNFKGGKAIFTEPIAPIKCGGAPQKILFLARDTWGSKAQIEFIKSADTVFGVKKYSDELAKLHSKHGTQVSLKTTLVEVNGKERIATFKDLATGELIKKDFDFLHAVPPHTPHAFLSKSGLTNEAGYVDVNKFTLQHNKFQNIWGLGDCANLPTSKTAAAAFGQTPIIVQNLKNAIDNRPPKATYNGYTSCPIFVGGKKLMLAEFLYDNVVNESFFTNQEVPRRSFFWLKKSFFPSVYWYVMPRGFWLGKDGVNFKSIA